jgi:hypothetical protein
MEKPKLLILAFLFVAIGSCKKKKDDENSCVAGSGGNVTFVAIMRHHTTPIYNLGYYNDTVYVKYNTQDLPGLNPSDFDTFFVGDSGEDHVHLENLKCGKYYFYGAAFDTSLQTRVTGGRPFDIAVTSGEIIDTVFVTE